MPASTAIQDFSTPKYPMSPFELLAEMMARPFRAKTPPFKSRLELAMNPPEVDSKPTFKPGAVSRGIDDGIYSTPKDRMFNWTSYNDSRAFGKTPMVAAYDALPRIVYKNGDPTNYKYGHSLSLSEGAISRGETPYLDYTQGGFLDNFSQSDKSRALEKVFSSKSLSNLKSELGEEFFRVPTGSILRGDGRVHVNRRLRKLSDLIEANPSSYRSIGLSEQVPLEKLHRTYLDEYLEGVDPSILNDEWFQKAESYARKRLQQTMRERANPALRR